MQKAGTGWLYQAFSRIDGFQMSPIKEFHHFDKLGETDPNSLARHRKSILRQTMSGRGNLSVVRRIRLLASARKYINSGFSTEAYLDLFQKDRNGLTGDFTPSYSTLNSDTVAIVQSIVPDIPVILSIRHPVDRFWSSFNMSLRRRFASAQAPASDDFQDALEKEATVENLNRSLSNPKNLARSKPSVSHDAWSIYHEKMIVVSLEEIITQPKSTMEKLASKVMRRKIALPDTFHVPNNKASNPKVRMSDAHRAVLFDAFQEEIQTCKQRFPEIAEDWQTS